MSGRRPNPSEITNAIDDLKNLYDAVTERERNEADDHYDTGLAWSNLMQADNGFEGLAGVTRLGGRYLNIATSHTQDPGEALECANKAMKALELAVELGETGRAFKHLPVNPANACAAAWAGPAIGKSAADLIRYAAGMKVDKETQMIENRVFGAIGGGTTSGASLGALIGLIGGPIGAAIGATLGGAFGSVAGVSYLAMQETGVIKKPTLADYNMPTSPPAGLKEADATFKGGQNAKIWKKVLSDPWMYD